MASISRKSAAVALAVVGVAGLSLASAASLGVTTASLGAGGTAVESCDDSVAVSYTTSFHAGSGEYRVTGATVTGLDGAACAGQSIGIALDGVAQAEQPIVAADTSKVFSGLTISARDLSAVDVVIHG